MPGRLSLTQLTFEEYDRMWQFQEVIRMGEAVSISIPELNPISPSGEAKLLEVLPEAAFKSEPIRCRPLTPLHFREWS